MNTFGDKEPLKQIIDYSKELRLPAIRRYLETALKEAKKNNLSHERFLHDLLQKEYDARLENGKLSRIRIANFPAKKYIEDLKVEELPMDYQKKLNMLKSLDFVKNGQNIILAGSPDPTT